ncbi:MULTISPECIES: RNA polymerase sigma factor [Croceitalea]|uniref:RNA polymerase sigma factor n=1 Tax=Croceitalea vernalis TaxID=3075599 RepID=A0ABU3BL89_9FLAO|nr:MULTISPECIES: RNA polymerase sigma factor [unclassified Croceitalea]MDT0541077.1 RNA polymerase sigma factor [Croceitalea sp. P059]MDT0622935.1 RNA polymerase sigma factor [Croceitalea sp. P007]
MTFLKRLFLILINQDKKSLGADNPYSKLTDEELVSRIVAKNDTMLFGVLYDRYSRMVYNKCYGFSRSQDEAEDLAQDVFLMLFIKLASFKGKSKFSTWLYSFTYNFCVNYVNRNKQRKMSDKSVPMETTEYKLTEEVPDESIYEMKASKLAKALEMISAEDKSILLLKYQDGASIKELSDLFEIGESAVKMRLKRAKAKLLEIYNTLG